MDFTPQTTHVVPPPEPGRFTWSGVAIIAPAAVVFGGAWAWAAVVAQAYFAPWLLFPILLGVFSGLSVVAAARFARIGNRRTILAAAVLAALVAGVGQHYLGYAARYLWCSMGPLPAESTMTRHDLSALVRGAAPGVGKYMDEQARLGRLMPGGWVARQWLAWLTWAIDALLVVVGSVVVTIPALWQPYCNRCGTWYRTMRHGRIDLPTARRLAELLDVDECDRPRSPRYRLSTCQSGCGPTRCELSWEGSDGGVSLARVWLDATGRQRVTAVLDESGAERGEG